jgi:hypothetical protein
MNVKSKVILAFAGLLLLAGSGPAWARGAAAAEIGRYEAVQLDATSIFVLDTKEGYCWVVDATPSSPNVVYTGQVRPGTKMGETIKPPKEKKKE